MSFDTPLNPILITHSHILQTTLLQSTALNFNFLSSYPNPLHYCSPVRAPALWTEPKHMQNSTTFWSRETGTSIWGLFRNTAGGQYTFRIKMSHQRAEIQCCENVEDFDDCSVQKNVYCSKVFTSTSLIYVNNFNKWKT